MKRLTLLDLIVALPLAIASGQVIANAITVGTQTTFVGGLGPGAGDGRWYVLTHGRVLPDAFCTNAGHRLSRRRSDIPPTHPINHVPSSHPEEQS